ncbi:hypothetical protein AMECASPLE_005919 [Ameca splendens]|uniref:Uncharacterized protein n=1 Tax=Ameca splendens TaxID=208324 RepID=A0ABV0ZV52_9TELE
MVWREVNAHGMDNWHICEGTINAERFRGAKLINISKAKLILQLQPQIPDELKWRSCGCRAGAKGRERRRKFNSIQFYLYSANSQHMLSQGTSQQSGTYIPINPNH